jgi:hypothetical protein
MVSRREALAEALRIWRDAERALGGASDVSRPEMEADVIRFRGSYQLIYTENMVDSMVRLRDADDRRARATPSTAEFHAATQDTEEIAADIWEQARRGDLDSPQTRQLRVRPGMDR